MAYTVEPIRAWFKQGNERFAILHDDSRLRIYRNCAGEIFAENARNEGFAIQISAERDGGLFITAQNATLSRVAGGDVPAFRVRAKGKHSLSQGEKQAIK